MSLDHWIVVTFSLFCAYLYYQYALDEDPGRPRGPVWGWSGLMVGWVLPLYAFGDEVSRGLRRLAAVLSWSILRLIGFPVRLEKETLFLPNHYLDITPVCDGFYTLYFLVMLCAFLAILFEHGWKRRLLFILAGAVLALLSNAVRIAVLALVVHRRGEGVLETNLHGGIGSVTFLMAFSLMFAWAWISGLGQRVKKESDQADAAG